MTTCRNGHEAGTANFCPECGAKLDALKGERQFRICLTCSAVHDAADNHCPACGRAVESLPAGLPLSWAVAWRGVFERVGWREHGFGQHRRGLTTDHGIDKRSLRVLKEAGFLDGEEDPADPVVFSLTKYQLDHPKLVVGSRAFSARALDALLATRTRFVVASTDLPLRRHAVVHEVPYSAVDGWTSEFGALAAASRLEWRITGPGIRVGLPMYLNKIFRGQSSSLAWLAALSGSVTAAGGSGEDRVFGYMVASDAIDVLSARAAARAEAKGALTSLVDSFMSHVAAVGESGFALAGWYPDPVRHHESREWDGARWTDRARSKALDVRDPLDRSAIRAPLPRASSRVA